MRRLMFAASVAVILAVPGYFIWKAKMPAGPRPNVILISIDTLAAKHISTYGYARRTTPFIDRWAEENFVFENSYSASSYTAPSHMSMFTGLHVAKHKFTRYFEGDSAPLDPKIPTLPQLMRAAGYDTAWFGVLDDDHLDLKRGFERGFDYFSQSDNSTELTRERLDWLLKSDGRPKFVFMHSYLVHAPYTPPEAFIGEFDPSNRALPYASFEKYHASVKDPDPQMQFYFSQFDLKKARDRARLEALYDEEIRYMDSLFGQTIAALKSSGVYDKTIVILTSDHGEAFWEHGFRDHMSLHREVLNVPLIIHVPGVKPGRSPVAVQGIDLLPALMEAIGARTPPVDGKSFWGVLARKESPVLHAKVYAQTDVAGPFLIQDREWKIIEQDTGENSLYRLTDDPWETKNISDDHPAVVERYKKYIREVLYDGG